MLRSHRQGQWHIGTTSIRANSRVTTGLRFVNWQHYSNDDASRKDPPPRPTILTYSYIEQWLNRSDGDGDTTLVLTTARNSAVALQNYFHSNGKKANAETAVKVAGATARRCIVLHGRTNFLSGSRHNEDFDSECFTRANVAYSRATDLTVLACPVNMQGIPGALQVIAALLHGVCAFQTGIGPTPPIMGRFDTAVPSASPLLHLVEHHGGKARRLRLVLASQSLLYQAAKAYMPNCGRIIDSGLLFAVRHTFIQSLTGCLCRTRATQMPGGYYTMEKRLESVLALAAPTAIRLHRGGFNQQKVKGLSV